VAGWEVLTAGGGAEGIQLAASRQPDAILLDVMMPELDGPATLEALRERDDTRAIPVLFMTAKAQAGELSRYASLGVAGVIPKPFDPMTLHERVSGVLGWDAF
jgi:CheY-like chemotaxis protein